MERRAIGTIMHSPLAPRPSSLSSYPSFLRGSNRLLTGGVAMSWLAATFGVAKPVIGMIHLPPLPGTALYDDVAGVAGIIASARRDAEALQAGGIDAVMFGNEGDRPYRTRVGPETIATM